MHGERREAYVEDEGGNKSMIYTRTVGRLGDKMCNEGMKKFYLP